jgi:hypothetical protein
MTANAPTQTAHRAAASPPTEGNAAFERKSNGDALNDEVTSFARVGARDSLAEAAARVAALGVLLQHFLNHPLTGTAEIPAPSLIPRAMILY